MVTSRATGDDLIEDEDTQSADITAPPRAVVPQAGRRQAGLR